jgi:CHASE2 domain-containing sensor protein
MKYADDKINLSVFALIIGSVWILLTYFLLRTKKILILVLQINILILTIIGIGYSLIKQEVFHRIDFVMLVIGSLVSLYLIFYLKKLIQTKPDDL